MSQIGVYLAGRRLLWMEPHSAGSAERMDQRRAGTVYDPAADPTSRALLGLLTARDVLDASGLGAEAGPSVEHLIVLLRRARNDRPPVNDAHRLPSPFWLPIEDRGSASPRGLRDRLAWLFRRVLSAP